MWGWVAGAGVPRPRRMRSCDSVTSVVGTDRTTVAATIVTTVHSGKCAAADVAGGVTAEGPEVPVVRELPMQRGQDRPRRSGTLLAR